MPKLDIGKVSINYEFEGSGLPVVFINGLTMDLNGWAEQAEFFSSRYKVLRYDCRGQGQSDKPDMTYAPEVHAEDLNVLLDRLGIARAHIVSLSNGGMVAQHLALDYPARVGALVLVDTCSHIGPLLRLMLNTWLKAIKVGGNALRFDLTTPLIFSESYVEKNLTKIEMMKEYSEKTNIDLAVSNLISGSMEHNVRKRLGEIEAPTLILHGAEDILIPPKYAHILNEGISGSRLVIFEGIAHVPPYEASDDFNREVLSFIGEHDDLLEQS